MPKLIFLEDELTRDRVVEELEAIEAEIHENRIYTGLFGTTVTHTITSGALQRLRDLRRTIERQARGWTGEPPQ